MRVLFVAAHLAGPAFRGDQLRARELLSGLSRRHQVTVVDLVYPQFLDPAKPPVDCERYVPVRVRRGAMAMRAGLALLSRSPLQAALYDSSHAAARIAALVREDAFDIAHVQLARLGPLLPSLAPLPVVLDFIDALSTNMRNRAAFDRGITARLAAIEATRMTAYERALCRRVDIGVVCSVREREAIGKFRNLRVVPMGVRLPEPTPALETAPDAGTPKLILSGNLGYFPNVDAALWFVDNVMPMLRADVPGVTLELAGARPGRRLIEHVAALPDVSLAANVADMRSRIAAATISVAPLRAGSGQQTKILEAMSMRTPVVATSTAASGLDAVDGEHLLIADSPEAMRDAIVRLLRQWPLRMRLADAGRRLVETRHRWDDQIDALDALWSEAAAAGSRRSPRR